MQMVPSNKSANISYYLIVNMIAQMSVKVPSTYYYYQNLKLMMSFPHSLTNLLSHNVTFSFVDYNFVSLLCHLQFDEKAIFYG